jgi:hypothetical protein
MKRTALIAAAACWALPALAAGDEADGDAAKAVHAALADRAEPFAMPPALPDAVSDRAKDAGAGQPGARRKADAAIKAQEEAGAQGKDAAKEADADLANRAAHGAAASAAGSANADNHAAAGQERATSVRNAPPSTTPGGGHGH